MRVPSKSRSLARRRLLSPMASRCGALYHERQLRDEVLYLHSLWNQGIPPSSSANPNPNSTFTHLRPRSSLSFIKYRNRRRRTRNAVVSEKEWPCDPTPDQIASTAVTSATGWPEPLPKLAPPSPSAEDLAKAAAFRSQMSGVEACKRFFSRKNREGDCDDSSESEEEEEVEEGAFKLFLEIFTKDHGLRKYYEGNLEKGEFLCLVCEGSGAKKGRRYGDCAGLVQHCSSLAKIGRRGAHRGLAKAVCRVMGWNFSRLPMFVLDLEETLGQCLARGASQQQMQEESQKGEQIQSESDE